MIEVSHNPLALRNYALVTVRNPIQVEKFLNKYCLTKRHRGYRLRFVPDVDTSTIELGARSDLELQMAIRVLKERKFYKWHTKQRLSLETYSRKK